MTVFINDISLIGPGLVDRETIEQVLHGEKKWQYEELPTLRPEMLPANESRRLTSITKLALTCIQNLLKDGDDLASIATVFSSSDVDLNIVDKMCTSLSKSNKLISPTLFHNSVHNAPAGYWSIAASMRGPSTSVSSGEASFMCGLQEAITQVKVDRNTVFFVAYDYPAPEILNRYRNCKYPLAIALRLSCHPEKNVFGSISLKSQVELDASKCRNISLEPLRESVPIGCGLPLIEALIRRARMEVIIPYLHDQMFKIEISH